jgi:glycine cleavage system H protein
VEFPSDVRYSLSHCWARLEGDIVTVGITEYAQQELGELQYVGLPRVGASVALNASLGELESTKTVSEFYAPCAGSVLEVNEKAISEPAMINRDPFGDGWLVRIAPADLSELYLLVDNLAYQEAVEGEPH